MAAILDFKMADSFYSIHYLIIRKSDHQNIYFDTTISFLPLMVMKILAKIEIHSDGDRYHGNGGF